MKIPTILLLLLLLLLISHTTSLSPVPPPTTHPSPPHKPSPESLPPPPAAAALPPSPAISGPDCSTDLLNLTSCLTFVEKNSNLTVPEKGCCSAFAGLVNSNPVCLCQLLASSEAFGIKIDDAKALALPTICHVQTPPVSLCSVLGIPVPSPGAFSPEGGGAGEPSGSGPSASTSVAAAPSGSGDGSSKARIASLQIALFAIISQMFVILF